uniref:Xylanolytic transcriptional activator regulatory domain-containing protein n=1 Tax=Bionectria ochroleuca TaxID=29856 RepID=A0A0B7KI44_BIOOC
MDDPSGVKEWNPPQIAADIRIVQKFTPVPTSTLLWQAVQPSQTCLQKASHPVMHAKLVFLAGGARGAVTGRSPAVTCVDARSVGACARQGLALGVDKLLIDGVGSDNIGTRTWQEVEERRRAWWAVLMLDRFSSLSNPARPLSTEDPPFDAFLPVDDAVWDDWSSAPGDSIRFSASFNLKMGSFARLAQATHLLSQALRSISLSVSESDVTQADETAQLRRTLLALVSVADKEATVRKLEYCAPSALSLSAILLLEENKPHQDNPRDDLNSPWLSFESLWSESRTALNRLSAAAVSYSATCPAVPDAPHIVPIFLIHVMYQVVSILLRISQGSLNGDIRDQISSIRHFLEQIAEPILRF